MNNIRADHKTSNSYSTSFTKGLSAKMSDIGSELKKVMILEGSDSNALLIDDVNGIVTLRSSLENIPAFAHPFYYEGNVYIDARAFTTKEGNIKDVQEFSLLKKRAILEKLWIEDKAEFGSQAELITDVFASWFSNGVTRRLNMSMLENNQLRILAAVYYLHFLHRDTSTNVDACITTLYKVLPKILRVPATLIDDLVTMVGEEKIAMLYRYEGENTKPASEYLSLLIECFNDATDNSYKLNISVVINSLARGSFVSANSPELVSMAIEYPPIMFLMIWYAASKGIQGKTSIGLTVGSVIRRHNEDRFNKFMDSILV